MSVFDRLGLPLAPSNTTTSLNASTGLPPPLIIYKNHVSDSQIVSGAITNAALGLLCLLAWGGLRGTIPFYAARLRLLAVCVRPPPQPTLGTWRQLFDWIGPTLTTSDADLARTAGLDALVTHRVLTFGVLFFFPVALVGCAVLLPVYARGGVQRVGAAAAASGTPGAWLDAFQATPAERATGTDALARLTLAHVRPGAANAWLPAAFSVCAIAYGCWLLDRLQAEWLLLRQLYLSSGEPLLSGWVTPQGEGGGGGGDHHSAAVGVRAGASLGAVGAAGHERDLAARQRRLPGKSASAEWEAVAVQDAAAPPATPVEEDVEGEEAPTAATNPGSRLPSHPLLASASSGEPATSLPPTSTRLVRYWTDTLTLANAANGTSLTIPSVPPAPFRKTLRVVGADGTLAAVPAELYAVLALDVPPPPAATQKLDRPGSWAGLVSSPAGAGGVGGGAGKEEEGAAPPNGAAAAAPTAPPGDLVATAAGLVAAAAAQDDDGQTPPPRAPGFFSSLAALGGVCGAPLRSAHTAAAASAFFHGRRAPPSRAAPRLPAAPLPGDGGARTAPTPPLAPPPQPHPMVTTTTTRAIDPRASPAAWFAAASRLGGRPLVDAVFARLCPGDFLGSVPVQDARPVHAALLAWDWACVGLEEAEKAAAAAERAGRERPVVVLGGGRGWHGGWWARRRRLAHHPPDPEAASTTTVDAVAVAAGAAVAAESRVLAAQQAALASAGRGEACSSFVALFATQAAAAAAAAVPAFPQGWGRSFRVAPAPGADEVAWQALATPPGPARTRDRAAGAAWLVTFICLPVGIFAGAAANVQYAVCTPPGGGGGSGTGGGQLTIPPSWPPARRAFCSPDPSLARALLTGWAPSICLAAYSCLAMPRALMRGCQLLRADVSLSGLDTRVFWCFFIWTFFNVILGGMLSGSALLTVPAAIKNPGVLYKIVGSAMPASSNFFIAYLQTQALLMVPFRLLWPCGVPLATLLRRLRLSPWPPGSPARAAAADLPHVSFRMGRELGGVAFNLFAIALAYGAVAPLVLPFAALWSAGAWVVWRHQLLYVYERAYESGGAAPWRCIRSGGAWTLAAHGFFTGCALVAKEAFYVGGALALAAPAGVGVWFWRATARADSAGRGGGSPGLLAAAAPRAVPDGVAYTPPALRFRAAGWAPWVDAAWVGWGGIGPYAPRVAAR